MNYLPKQCYYFQDPGENKKDKPNVSNLSTQMSPNVEAARTVSDVLM